MPGITFSVADFRDAMESRHTLLGVEGPVDRDDDGSCYCYPPPTDSENGEPRELRRRHVHLTVRGTDPEASPRYYELPRSSEHVS